MNDQLLDLDEFKERVQDDIDLLLELLDIFMADYVGKRAALGEAISKKDIDQLKSVAHSLKGASGNISAKSLREIFLQMEDMAKKNDLSPGNDLLAKLDETYTALTKRIETVKQELK
ncbi:MAG TPA: Hpt domain-containing protein [Candidatus Omnitrophota bacterium]|nr:Hpt domain-containing protein [Candidatus Omnitrophota bacterium]